VVSVLAKLSILFWCVAFSLIVNGVSEKLILSFPLVVIRGLFVVVLAGFVVPFEPLYLVERVFVFSR
jgi:hypothetical protein